MAGKFEGEPEYVEDYYNLSMDGADESYINEYDNQVDVFKINPGDPGFDEIGHYSHIAIWEDDHGFVYHRLFESQASLTAWLETIGAE